jgi:predicted Rossmann fold flavoprotein
MGVETIEREDGKIFPVSMRSKDVLNALVTSIKSYDQTEIKTGVQVLSITENNLGFSVGVKGESFTTKSVVLATGGYTYPKLGTTGDGYLMADKLGHEIVAPKPALAAVYIKSDALKELQGLVIREMSCTVERQKKRIYSFSGDILCTHFGLSGPGILDHSRYIEKGDVLKLNWAGIEADKLNHIILEVIASHGRNPLSYLMNQLNLPDRVKQFVLKEVQLNGLMKLAELTKENRKKIVDALTGYEVRINRLSDLNEAMVTSGGVGLRQINPKTMMSKIINGLYFVGEVMDVDGDTGGYNLQWAFASAYVAAEQIKQLDGEDAYAK